MKLINARTAAQRAERVQQKEFKKRFENLKRKILIASIKGYNSCTIKYGISVEDIATLEQAGYRYEADEGYFNIYWD